VGIQEQIGMAATSYVFRIELPETKVRLSTPSSLSEFPAVIVEVLPAALRNAELPGGERDKVERSAAERMARVAALEALRTAIPQGTEPACLIAQLGELPELVRSREPNLRKSGLNAWLLPSSSSSDAAS
jgi:hypothetical protein